ncbi:probable serine/threonine-protein kinase MARK-A [Drosophila nasuta]|uniref:probable serine/threonine-protein kinase MARK-A n=1 Tax=Drosophila nasuta TaxID=42062 RepID=UPI00295EBA8F|nr:probable serine/threonine-protein kinase MARK-A [Drosophila nasuta]
MTVKLAKLFGSSSSNSNGGGSNNKSNNSNSAATNASGSVAATANGQQQPPPLPPPNANMKLIKYYDPHHHHNHNHHHHHQPAAMTIYGHAYECNVDLEDDYDDNNMCMQRNHPYNNSQRPLLGERRPQLTLMTAVGKKKTAAAATPPTTTITTAPMAGIPLPAPPLPPQRQLSNNSACISPYVQQQKRDSVKGLHGFNDFDVLSQQYNQHLQSSPHIGYPYGSPPSPTVQSSDFCFDTDRQQREREREQSFKAISSSSSSSNSSSSNNSTATTKSNCSSNSAPRYGNVSGYQDTAATTPYYLEQSQRHNSNSNTVTATATATTQSSRFEDDFCTRRNVDFVASQAAAATEGGPFIFGISHEQQQTDYGHRRCSISSQHSNNIITNSNNINCKTNNNNLNRPVINATPTLKEHNALQQSLSDTSADSGKGGKFLLRKRKSKKTAAAAAAIVANAEHKGKQGRQQQQQQQPSIKCVLVGDGAVGKTNLILSYLENRFNPEHVPTASDIYNVDVNVNESPVHLQLCDTAGQDTLDPLRELCYPDSDVFLLCFSVVKPETFGAIKSKWAPKFAKTKAALILVGTQSDLRSNLNVLNKLQTNGEKPISYADAWDLATTIGAKYIETSSATQDKVKDVFDAAIWEGLVPTTLPPTPSFWKKLFCLA